MISSKPFQTSAAASAPSCQVDLSELSQRSDIRHQQLQQLRRHVASTLQLTSNGSMQRAEGATHEMRGLHDRSGTGGRSMSAGTREGARGSSRTASARASQSGRQAPANLGGHTSLSRGTSADRRTQLRPAIAEPVLQQEPPVQPTPSALLPQRPHAAQVKLFVLCMQESRCRSGQEMCVLFASGVGLDWRNCMREM